MTNPSNPGTGPEFIEARGSGLPPGWRWQSVVGQEALDLLATIPLSDTEKQRLRDESVAILSHCLPPTGTDGHHAGLVVGNIQSGKTMSFTTVSALARDNGYQVIIALTGTIRILNSQSVKRLSSQLRILSRGDLAWHLYRNPRSTQTAAHEIAGILHDWRHPTPRGLPPQTILITLLKTPARLKAAAELLERLDLTGVPSLIIDDEADQAGLNTAVNRGDESATYRNIRRLRNALPHHTYLGYTATPQAPLLINIIDTQSARFSRVLTPGPNYTGGAAFFNHQPSLIRTIPDAEVPTDAHPLQGPPESLLEALRIFFLGVTIGILDHQNDDAAGNRSMLVHPSMRTASHYGFFNWIRALTSSWVRLLDGPVGEPDRQALVEEFRAAYLDLGQTQPSLAAFDELMAVLPQAIRRTIVYEINRRASNPFPGIEDIDEFWRQGYSFILVGGQSLERGFTVEGLTVTYMPRGLGAGHADTIQQRARFYGYNRGTLGLSRVYLENAARDAYRDYVEHEDDLRSRLEAHSATGRPLTEWRRLFFLDASLKPTRDNILDIDYTRGPAPDRAHIAMPPIESREDLDENRRLVASFLAPLSLLPDDGDPRRTLAQKHEVDAEVPLEEALERLLVPLRINDSEDLTTYFQIRLQLQRYMERNPGATCVVYRMKPGYEEMRSLTAAGRIQPFQGANASTGYPGDIAIRAMDKLTIQVYNISELREEENGPLIATDVPLIAVFLPANIARAMVVQDQGDSLE